MVKCGDAGGEGDRRRRSTPTPTAAPPHPHQIDTHPDATASSISHPHFITLPPFLPRTCPAATTHDLLPHIPSHVARPRRPSNPAAAGAPAVVRGLALLGQPRWRAPLPARFPIQQIHSVHRLSTGNLPSMRRRTSRGIAVGDTPEDGIPMACHSRRVRRRRDLSDNLMEGLLVAGDGARPCGTPRGSPCPGGEVSSRPLALSEGL